MLAADGARSRARSASPSARSPTASGGRWPAAGRARSPMPSSPSAGDVAVRSSPGRRIERLADIEPARAVLFDLTPAPDRRDRRRPAAGPDSSAARAVPPRAGRLQDRLGARRADPVVRPGRGSRRDGPPRRDPCRARRIGGGGRTRPACRPPVRPARPAEPSSTRRAPRAGKHTAWAYCHVPGGSTVDMTRQIEDQVERFAPGFRDLVLARATRTAVDMEAYDANYVGGDINGGIQDWRQLLFRPIPSLDPYHLGRGALRLLVVDAARRRRPRHVRLARGPIRAAPGVRPAHVRVAIGGWTGPRLRSTVDNGRESLTSAATISEVAVADEVSRVRRLARAPARPAGAASDPRPAPRSPGRPSTR